MTEPMTFEFQMKSDPKMLKSLSDFILSSVRTFKLPRSILDDLVITADEIATNIILHAYKKDPQRVIRVRIDLSSARAVLTFSHDGEVFQPDSVARPDFKGPLAERRISGMGLYIINHLMDQVAYKFKQKPDDENSIKVVKNFADQGATHAS